MSAEQKCSSMHVCVSVGGDVHKKRENVSLFRGDNAYIHRLQHMQGEFKNSPPFVHDMLSYVGFQEDAVSSHT